jgi:transcriptional regulator with XRE-family HTH domain
MPRIAITETILRNRLGSNVRSKRTASSLTVKKAAKRAQMNPRHWQKIEAGQSNTTLFTLARIAEALDVEPGHLLLEPPRRTPEEK